MSKTDNQVFIATESFTCEIDGEHYAVIKGKTRVRGEHPLVQDNPEYFKPVDDDITYELETAMNSGRGGRRGPEPSETKIEIPEGAVPGETPGWPVHEETGEPLDLTPEQREELVQAALDAGETENAEGSAGDSEESAEEGAEPAKPAPEKPAKPAAEKSPAKPRASRKPATRKPRAARKRGK
jgi:hypothetical protein